MVRLTDHPDMILDVYGRRKTTTQQQYKEITTILSQLYNGVFFFISSVIISLMKFCLEMGLSLLIQSQKSSF